jgi:dTDP-4-amino-4,6-dideoxygalactose transaminase
VDSGAFVLGPELAAFEQEAAAKLGAGHAVGVANGTDAIVLVLQALGIGEGDEVICPAFTFYATAEAIARLGARPVFADIDLQTLNLDVEDVSARITARTKAILAVHLFGRPAPIAELSSLGLPVVEDAAQAFGAHRGGVNAGAMGTAATFSFYPTKNLFALGDGGLVATHDPEIDEILRLLRHHGSVAKQTFQLVGYNSRLDDMQAAVLRLFLGEIDGWNHARRTAASRYRDLGLEERLELPTDEPGHIYHLYVARTPERDQLAARLRAGGIGCAVYYDVPLHLQPVFSYLGYSSHDLPRTMQAAAENIALPMWAGISLEQQERVAEGVLA